MTEFEKNQQVFPEKALSLFAVLEGICLFA